MKKKKSEKKKRKKEKKKYKIASQIVKNVNHSNIHSCLTFFASGQIFLFLIELIECKDSWGGVICTKSYLHINKELTVIRQYIGRNKSIR